jgi:hypothetical protein
MNHLLSARYCVASALNGQFLDFLPDHSFVLPIDKAYLDNIAVLLNFSLENMSGPIDRSCNVGIAH